MLSQVQTRRHLLLLLAIISCLCFLLIHQVWNTRNQPIYFAVAGPMSGANEIEGKAIWQGVELAIQEANAEGGVNGKSIKLVQFDDRNDPELAVRQAEKIVRDGRISLVLGHHYSSTSVKAGEIYKAAKIPAISGSATAEAVTLDNPWYFRTIFSSSRQARFLANYALKILDRSRISIIADRDIFGQSLGRNFENAFRGSGGEVAYRWDFDFTQISATDAAQQVIRELAAQPEKSPGTIFLALHRKEATELVATLESQEFRLPLLGSAAISGIEFAQSFADYPQELAEPGYFSNGMYSVTPIVYDLVGNRGQEFIQKFSQTYSNPPNRLASMYYDAAKMGILALRRISPDLNQLSLPEQRQKLRQSLSKFSDADSAYEGTASSMYFDRHGNAIGTVWVGTFEKQNFISALTQLQGIPNPIEAEINSSEFQAKLDRREIVLMNSEYMNRINVVYTGIDITQVSEIDLSQSSYFLDFYLWFRYREGLDIQQLEFINAIPLVGQSGLELGEPINSRVEDGVRYQSFRVKSRFRGNFEFHSYPFDIQHIDLKFRHQNLTRDRLIFVRDEVGMQGRTLSEIRDKWLSAGAFTEIGDWFVDRLQIFSDTLTSTSTLGDPNLYTRDRAIEYSEFNVSLYIQRKLIGFSLKNLLPLIFFLMIAYAVFLLPPNSIGVESISGILLGVVFFHLSLISNLPNRVSYVVTLDYIFYTVYTLLTFKLIVVVICKQPRIAKHERIVQRFIRQSRIIFAFAIVGGITFLGIYYRDFFAQSQTVDVAQVEVEVSPTPPIHRQWSGNEAVDANSDRALVRWGSGRIDDREAMEAIIAKFERQHPNIDVQFSPTRNYPTVVSKQLLVNRGPELLELPSWSFKRRLSDLGYLAETTFDLTVEEGALLDLHFDNAFDDTDTEREGHSVSLLVAAHGIYYNPIIFAALELETPQTWEELLETARVLQANGYLPFANRPDESEHFLVSVLTTVAPNWIGGREGRMTYLNGDRCFDDERFVAFFQAIADLAPFLNSQTEDRSEDAPPILSSRETFQLGKAAMYFGTSDEARLMNVEVLYGSSQQPFAWQIFPVPAPQGEPTYITWHPTLTLGVNGDAPEAEAAQTLLQWLATPEVEEKLANTLRGSFPLHTATIALDLPALQSFFQQVKTAETDSRWFSGEISEGIPSGDRLIRDAGVAVVGDRLTPEAAAQQLQRGLAQWFDPAQRCLKPD